MLLHDTCTLATVTYRTMRGRSSTAVKEYVQAGPAHTNGVESSWAMLKRGYVGTYHQMSPDHLHRYVNELRRPTGTTTDSSNWTPAYQMRHIVERHERQATPVC